MKNKLSVIYILLAGALWGSSCLFVNKLIAIGFAPIACTAIRIVFGALILNLALIIKGRGLKLYRISGRALLLSVFSGVCSVLAMCVCYYYCMSHTSAAISAILLYTAPMFVMIMSVIFFKERITVKKVTVFCIAIVGCALVSGIASGASVSVIGLLVGVLSGFTYSLYGIITTFYMKEGGEPLTFSALSFAFAAVAALMISKPFEIVRIAAEYGDTLRLVGLFVLFSLCTAVLPFAFYTVGLVRVRPDVASILAFSEPLMAAVFGIVILKQPFDIWQAIGIILVTAAIVILNVAPRRRKRESE